jgi:hypothetical protein
VTISPRSKKAACRRTATRTSLRAAVAWWRLAKTAALCRRYSPPGAFLDFGAATGEIAHLLGRSVPYHFVEADDALASALLEWQPGARRERLEHLPPRAFHTISRSTRSNITRTWKIS